MFSSSGPQAWLLLESPGVLTKPLRLVARTKRCALTGLGCSLGVAPWIISMCRQDWQTTIYRACSAASVVSSSSLALWTVAHQAPLSMGFFRQGYWRGLSLLLQGIFSTQGSNQSLHCLLHDSVCPSLSHVSDSLQPNSLQPNSLHGTMDCSPPSFSTHRILQARILGVACHFLLRKIFPTRRSNPGIPHCRQTFYSLSHRGSLGHYSLRYRWFLYCWATGEAQNSFYSIILKLY